MVPLLVSLVILAKWKAGVNLVVLDTGERDDRLLSTERRGNHFMGSVDCSSGSTGC